MDQAPDQWYEVLHGPAFLINLDARRDRLTASRAELARAGFTDVRRVAAIDGRDAEALTRAWAACGSPPFAAWDGKFIDHPGKQGCFLSHVLLWREIAAQGLPYACVFEDDITFHREWVQLAPSFYQFTPKDFDLLMLGSQLEAPDGAPIARVPAHCLHAYLLTGAGAHRLSATVLAHPEGVATIDSMIVEYQNRDVRGEWPSPFQWYAWDGRRSLDPRVAGQPHEWRKRNTGLVFQDIGLGSDIG